VGLGACASIPTEIFAHHQTTLKTERPVSICINSVMAWLCPTHSKVKRGTKWRRSDNLWSRW
jgi:hypothetical protein